MQLPQEFRVGQNIVARRSICRHYQSRRTRLKWTSTARLKTWRNSLPSSKRRALLYTAASGPASGASHPGRKSSEVQRTPPALQDDVGGAPIPAPASAPLPPRPHSHPCRGRSGIRAQPGVLAAPARGAPLRPRRRPRRSPSPDPSGPCAFTRVIRGAPFPQRFRPPANVAKFTGDTNPGV